LASAEDFTAALRVDVASEIGGAVRVHTHHLVRGLDHFPRRELPLRAVDDDRLAGAIFLSTFVMISQNRADAKRQVVADLQWKTVQEADQQNRQLLDLSNQILELIRGVHAYARLAAASTPAATGAAEVDQQN
jgi:hypothetical protein